MPRVPGIRENVSGPHPLPGAFKAEIHGAIGVSHTVDGDGAPVVILRLVTPGGEAAVQTYLTPEGAESLAADLRNVPKISIAKELPR